MGEQSALPLYPRPMSTLTDTTLGPARWQPLRLAAATLGFLAGLLSIVGSFLPLITSTLTGGSVTVDLEVTGWGGDAIGVTALAEIDTSIPANGYPMVFAGIILIGAAFVCWFAAHPGAAAGAHRVAGLTTAIGGAFLAGTAWTVSVQIQASLDRLDALSLPSGPDFGITAEGSFGVGFWLMIVGTLMAAVAAVLALLPVSQARWPVGPPQPVDPNMTTPPFGIALPTQPPPVAPQELSVDPLTGEPLHGTPPHGAPSYGTPPHGIPPHVDPLTGQPYSPPAGMPVPSPPTGIPTPTPPPHGENGTAAAEVPDIVLPAPPPSPTTPPGPAIPLTDDPLAEPRRD